MTSLDLIAQKLDQVQVEQRKTDEKVSDVREGMYHPDEGLFARVRSVENWAEDHERRDTELRGHVTKIAEAMEPVTDDYKIRMSRRKWADRILWLLVSTAILGMLAVAKSHFIDEPADDKTEEAQKKR